MNQLSDLERVLVSLQGGSCLFQRSQGQMIGRCIGYLEHPFEKETALGFDDPPLRLGHMVLSHPKNRKIVHMEK